MLFGKPPSKKEIMRRTKRIQANKTYQRSHRLQQIFRSKGLPAGPAVDWLVYYTIKGRLIEFLNDYLNERSWGNDSFSITFPSAFYEDELEEFGPHAIVFAYNYGLNWEWEGVNEQEMCKYLEVAIEFFAEEHPEQEKEVYAYLDKIKEKYHVE